MVEGTQRRLAAIVSADVVGYSRLMGVDETGTLSALRAHRTELIDTKIVEHGGRIVKTMGDGLLLEFPSVVDATRCVIEIQQGMAARNDGVAEDRRIVFRVGVNLGDIIIEGEDILGDGVNVAARLQEIAAPGGIAVSRRVHEDVRDRLDTHFEDIGEQTLKNIARPVAVWRWSPVKTTRISNELETIGNDKPSIAVLPFDNMSSDPEHEYFADGIAEDIITALSKISRMRVIARNSTFTYKGKAHDLRQVASELGVRYVLEGSVRSGGNRLRITAQLIDANDGSHIWADRFDRTIDDIFDIQDEITKEIVTSLRVNLTDGEEARMWARGTNDIEAWQLCVRAHELLMKFNSTDYLEARVLAERALKRDSNYAFAWATFGFTFFWDGRFSSKADSKEKFEYANECAERALALDDSVSWAISLSAMVALSQGRDQEGVAIAWRGFELHPGNADLRAVFATVLTRSGQLREAVGHFHAAMSLNPFYPNWYRSWLARTLMMLDEFEEALALLDEIQSTEPAHINSWINKAYMFGQIGRMGDAEEAVKIITQLAPNLRLEHAPGVLSINDATATQRFIEGLRKVGFPE
jgi:adenylate cyclase